MEFIQYEMSELVFHLKEPKESHVTVDLSAEISDGITTKIVKGFYAGNGIYKIRFLPEIIGSYTYKVTGIVTEEGRLEVKAADKEHGLIRADGTHLRYVDGTYFHSFGTTVYALAHQTEELTEETFQTLANAPFNKVRMCVFPKHYNYNHNGPPYYAFHVLPGKTFVPKDAVATPEGVFRESVWDVHHPDFAFWDNFEEKMCRLQGLGIQVDLILFHPYDRWGFSQMSQQENLVYLDYLLRRFSAIPNIWWSMANEYDLCRNKSMENWYEIDEFIHENDPYRHMLSNHNCVGIYDFGRKQITHASIQKRTMNLVAELQQKYHKPVLYDECCYEGNLKETWGAISAREMTNRFWQVVVTGGYCTHGEVLLDQEDENLDEAVLWWAKGGKLKGESPKRIQFLKNLAEEIGKPLERMAVGFEAMMEAALKEAETTGNELPEFWKKVLAGGSKTDPVEMARNKDGEYCYVGHVDNEVYLYYYGINCSARTDIELPKDSQYTVEVIDAWNMTRKIVATGVSGLTEIRLPEREYQAVLARRENR